MSVAVEVTSPGALATIQDLGRGGWRRFGVPRAGALDLGLLRIANRLAGNDQATPAIEFFIAGPTFKALDARVRLAFAGDFPVTLQRAGETNRLESWRSVTLQPGESLRVGAPCSGRVGYVAVTGLDVPAVLGSASTYTRARLGGLQGRVLVAGDRLHVAAMPAPAPGATAPESVLKMPPVMSDGPIRVVLGPQDDHFDAVALATFFAADYRVSRDADRMGLRLEGPALQHRPDKGAEIVSDATVPGSIQVPGNGLPIVLLADGQTAGGYPKIATVISADLARLASAATGTVLRFAAVSVAQAEILAREREAELQRSLAAIAPLTLVDGVDLAAIYADNLVSAMIDALDPPP